MSLVCCVVSAFPRTARRASRRAHVADCRTVLAVSVYDAWSRSTRVISHGDPAAAVQASRTVPGLFRPVWHEGRPLIDGGILDRPGLAGMPTSERVLFHHLASRSPWRRVNGTAMAIPARGNMSRLVIADRPRVGPFHLGEGVSSHPVAARPDDRFHVSADLPRECAPQCGDRHDERVYVARP